MERTVVIAHTEPEQLGVPGDFRPQAEAVLELLPEAFDRAECRPVIDRPKPGDHVCLEAPCERGPHVYNGPGWWFERGPLFIALIVPFEQMRDPTGREKVLRKVRYAFELAERERV